MGALSAPAPYHALYLGQDMRGCYDREIPFNIVEAGLRGVTLEDGVVKVRMNLTAPGSR